MLHFSVVVDESDEKTRANAAGAIGNLVRNGGELAAQMANEVTN